MPVRLHARTLVATAAASLLSFAMAGAALAQSTRTLAIYNIHTKETIEATYKVDGEFVPEALKRLNHAMRDWRRNESTKMDPELIDLIWNLHRELGSQKPVHLISGYRSRKTNNSLRRRRGGQARNSRHILGKAADIHFPDVSVKDLRNSALIRERGGVGYYPKSGIPFVHVDTGRVRHWPRLPRRELALLFPKGKSKHVPRDGRPLNKRDGRIAMAKLKKMGKDRWTPSSRPKRMLASVSPTSLPSLTSLINRSLKPSGPTFTETVDVTGSISRSEEDAIELNYEPYSQMPIVTAAASGAGREPFALSHPDHAQASRLFVEAATSPVFRFQNNQIHAHIDTSLRFQGNAIRTFAAAPAKPSRTARGKRRSIRTASR